MRCGVAAAALLLVCAALPLHASKHALTPGQLGRHQKAEKHALRATAGVGAMKASQAITDVKLAVTSGKTMQDESFTERASTTRFSERVGALRGGFIHPEVNDALLLSSRTDMAMGASQAAGSQPRNETASGQLAAGVRPGGQSVALTKLMTVMPQKEASEDEGALVPVLKQKAVHAKKTGSYLARLTQLFTALVAVAFVVVLSMVLLHHWSYAPSYQRGRWGTNLNDVRAAVMRGKERQEAVSTLIAEWVIKTADPDADDEESGRY